MGLGDMTDDEFSRLQSKLERLKRKVKEQTEVSPESFMHSVLAKTKKKKKKKSKKKKKGNSSSTSSGSKSSASEALFHEATSREDSAGIQVVAKEQPGQLYQRGIEQITQVLGSRGVAKLKDGSENPLPRMVNYLVSCLHGRHPLEKMKPRTAHELRTTVTALDQLAKGDLRELADTLMQHFKMLEVEIEQGDWNLAKGLSLVEDTTNGLTSLEEMKTAGKHQLHQHRVEELRKKLKNRHG